MRSVHFATAPLLTERECMNNNKQDNNGRISALMPIALFIVLYVGGGIALGDFYTMPMTLTLLIALFAALMQNRHESFDKKLSAAAKGAGDSNIITMCIIYLLAGAFSEMAEAAGGVSGTVNLALSFIPANFTVTGLFLMGCFISMAMGTSVGTVVALTPIAVDISDKTGFAVPFTVGAVVCGAMFGDNLSFISDTTIAAVRTQGCKMRDKFKANFFIVLPAAVITAVIFFVMTGDGVYVPDEELTYNIVQVIPYLAVLVGALLGVNVFLLLGCGIVISAIAGLITGSINFHDILPLVGNGMAEMYEIVIIAIIASCISAVIKRNGGFDWVLSFVYRRMAGYRAAQIGIGVLVSILDFATANNTIAIVLAGPMAKQISEKHGISAERSASLLDIFGSVIQGILPYGAQLMTAAKLAGITSVVLLPNMFYPYLMGISAVLFIIFSRKKIKKD